MKIELSKEQLQVVYAALDIYHQHLSDCDLDEVKGEKKEVIKLMDTISDKIDKS